MGIPDWNPAIQMKHASLITYIVNNNFACRLEHPWNLSKINTRANQEETSYQLTSTDVFTDCFLRKIFSSLSVLQFFGWRSSEFECELLLPCYSLSFCLYHSAYSLLCNNFNRPVNFTPWILHMQTHLNLILPLGCGVPCDRSSAHPCAVDKHREWLWVCC